MDEGDIFDLIDGIYSTVDGTLSAQDMLDQMADVFELSLSTEQHIDVKSGSSALLAAASIHYQNHSSKLRELVYGYNSLFSEINRLPLIAFEKDIVREGKIMTTEDFMPMREWRMDEYYNEFFKVNEWEDHIGIPASMTDTSILSYTFARDKQNPLNKRTLDLLKKIVPHLVRSTKIRQTLGKMELNQQAGWEALNAATYGVVIISLSGKALFVNDAAERELRAGTAICICNGQLKASDPTANRALSSEVGAAIDSGTGLGMPYVGTAVALPCALRNKTMYLLCHPLRLSGGVRYPGRPACVVFLFDPSAEISVSVERLVDVFALTQTEAKIALLIAQGKSLEECADQMGHSLATSRTVLKRVFAKTDTKRQNELAHLILTMNVSLTS